MRSIGRSVTPGVGSFGLEPLRRLDRSILQFVERGPLRRIRLNRLGNAIDRKVGHARRRLIAELGETALVLSGRGFVPWRCGVEARLLFVSERLVEAIERRP